jgi:hypothetical protein
MPSTSQRGTPNHGRQLLALSRHKLQESLESSTSVGTMSPFLPASPGFWPDPDGCWASLLEDLEDWTTARDTYCATMLALQTGNGGPWSSMETSRISSWQQVDDHREICVREANSRIGLEVALLGSLIMAAHEQRVEICMARERSERSTIIANQMASSAELRWRLEEAIGLLRRGDHGKSTGKRIWTGPRDVDIDIISLMESYNRNIDSSSGLPFEVILVDCICAIYNGINKGKKQGYSLFMTRTDSGWSSNVEVICGSPSLCRATGPRVENNRYVVQTYVP